MGLELFFGIGVVILLGALVYGVMQLRRVSPREEAMVQDVVKRNYREEEAEGKAEGYD